MSSTSPSTLYAFQLEGLTINFIINFIFTTDSDLGDPQQHPHLCHLHQLREESLTSTSQ
jgi:hypothetical protein